MLNSISPAFKGMHQVVVRANSDAQLSEKIAPILQLQQTQGTQKEIMTVITNPLPSKTRHMVGIWCKNDSAVTHAVSQMQKDGVEVDSYKFVDNGPALDFVTDSLAIM